MTSPDQIFNSWNGMIANDLELTIQKAFNLPSQDDYIYAAGSYQVTLAEVQREIDSSKYRWTYWSPKHEKITISDTDIEAYTSIFASTTDTAKTLKSFQANAKQNSPRALVASHLISKRLYELKIKVPKLKKAQVNPYYDVWSWSCRNTRFLGPLSDHGYSNPANASQSHPMLPVLYHHFGCVCPSFEALHIIAQLSVSGDGVLEMASGNGYWTYMLRRMNVQTCAVDNLEAKWRNMWISDTVQMDGVTYLKKSSGAQTRVLLMVYMVTKGVFTKDVLRAYKGDTIVIAGTQNANRFTSLETDTVEEYFEREMREWDIVARIALPSFAGKDEGMFVYQRKSSLSK